VNAYASSTLHCVLNVLLTRFSQTTGLTAMILVTLSVKESTENDADISFSLKLGLVSSALASPALWFPKISVAMLLVRLMQPGQWAKVLLIYGPILSLLLLSVPAMIILFVQCNPIPGQWNPERYKPTCWGPNIAVDFDIVTNCKTFLFTLL
jgi:hypothetical protein